MPFKRRSDQRPVELYAETGQTAVASYQPVLPEGQPLDEYLADLIAEAKAAVQPADPSSENQ